MNNILEVKSKYLDNINSTAESKIYDDSAGYIKDIIKIDELNNEVDSILNKIHGVHTFGYYGHGPKGSLFERSIIGTSGNISINIYPSPTTICLTNKNDNLIIFTDNEGIIYTYNYKTKQVLRKTPEVLEPQNIYFAKLKYLNPRLMGLSNQNILYETKITSVYGKWNKVTDIKINAFDVYGLSVFIAPVVGGIKKIFSGNIEESEIYSTIVFIDVVYYFGSSKLYALSNDAIYICKLTPVNNLIYTSITKSTDFNMIPESIIKYENNQPWTTWNTIPIFNSLILNYHNKKTVNSEVHNDIDDNIYILNTFPNHRNNDKIMIQNVKFEYKENTIKCFKKDNNVYVSCGDTSRIYLENSNMTLSQKFNNCIQNVLDNNSNNKSCYKKIFTYDNNNNISNKDTYYIKFNSDNSNTNNQPVKPSRIIAAPSTLPGETDDCPTIQEVIATPYEQRWYKWDISEGIYNGGKYDMTCDLRFKPSDGSQTTSNCKSPNAPNCAPDVVVPKPGNTLIYSSNLFITFCIDKNINSFFVCVNGEVFQVPLNSRSAILNTDINIKDKYIKYDHDCALWTSNGNNGHIESLNNVPLDSCKKKCSNLSDCKGITYMPSLPENNTVCILKNNDCNTPGKITETPLNADGSGYGFLKKVDNKKKNIAHPTLNQFINEFNFKDVNDRISDLKNKLKESLDTTKKLDDNLILDKNLVLKERMEELSKKILNLELMRDESNKMNLTVGDSKSNVKSTYMRYVLYAILAILSIIIIIISFLFPTVFTIELMLLFSTIIVIILYLNRDLILNFFNFF